jgi:dihydrofolate reductase
MILSIIAAIARNNIIGTGNKLPWHISEDLKHFKRITTGHFVFMGRKCYESIGKPLPGRSNIIITRNRAFSAPGCRVAHSIEEAIQFAEDNNESEAFIIGGGEIYRQSISLAARLYITQIHHHFKGDITFPEIKNEWKEIKREDHPDGKPYSYSFITYKRV